MTPRRFDIPIHFKPLVSHNPRAWINKLMVIKRRKERRPVGLYTIPHAIRKIITTSVGIIGDEATLPPKPCEFTEEDQWFPNPRKIAKCLISKPTISEMGRDEEKVYCGMTYGPEFSMYEQKAKKRVAKTLKKMFIKLIPEIDEIIQKNKVENKKIIKTQFRKCLEKGKIAILKNKENEFREKEEELANNIQMERAKILFALQGNMETEMTEVNHSKKEFLKGAYEFQLEYLLKDNEKEYLKRMNIYSSIWNKILYNLKEKAKDRIYELNRCANQVIDDVSLNALRLKLEEENQRILKRFEAEVEITFKTLRGKVFAEELHIQHEKCKGDKIKNTVNIWHSLLVHVILLFDKVIVSGFRGKPGECNYFLTQTITEKFKKLILEMEDIIENVSGDLGKSFSEKTEEEISLVLSREKSEMTIDMTVSPPDKDLIIELNLFQVKKLLEETACALMTKPLQIAQFMRDRSVEIKPIEDVYEENSSYLLDRLADVYHIIEKMLMENQRSTFKEPSKDVPYTIETDPEVTERVNKLINVYRITNHIKALTRV